MINAQFSVRTIIYYMHKSKPDLNATLRRLKGPQSYCNILITFLRRNDTMQTDFLSFSADRRPQSSMPVDCITITDVRLDFTDYDMIPDPSAV